MQIYNIFGNGKTQTGSSGFQGPGRFHPVKLIKNLMQLFRRNHLAIVNDCHKDLILQPPGLHLDHLALGAIFYGVGHQVADGSCQQFPVGFYIESALVKLRPACKT